ncbi:hypothetical protein Tco_0392736 [Tanacetum coccineum]
MLECKVLKSGCDMVGSIASQHSVEHRRPIKRMVFKSGSDMDGRIAPLHSVQQRWPILHMILKSRRDMDGQIALLHSIKHHWPNKRIVSRTVRYQHTQRAVPTVWCPPSYLKHKLRKVNRSLKVTDHMPHTALFWQSDDRYDYAYRGYGMDSTISRVCSTLP